MIECKRLKASFLTPDTCVANQAELAAILPKIIQRQKEGKDTAVASYQKVEKCRDCPTGLNLYQKHLEKEKETMQQTERKCHTCNNVYPLTKEYFDKFPKGFTLACRYCRGTKKKVDAELVKSTPARVKVTDQPLESKRCKQCGKEFFRENDEQSVSWNNRRYCSADCRVECEKERKKKYTRKSKPSMSQILENLDEIVERLPSGLIVLDLRGETELHRRIGKWAASRRRDVTSQILWNLEDKILPAFERAQ